MGAQERPPVTYLTQELQNNGPHYRFFQLLWLLKRYDGLSQMLSRPIRFRSQTALAFQPAEVAVQVEAEGLVVETPLLGLYGTSSPLPIYYSEAVLDDSAEAEVLRGFLDLFNHRAHQLLQASWEKYRCYLQVTPAADDATTEQIAALARLGRHHGFRFQWVDRRRLLPLTGLLSFCSSSVRVIEQVLRYYFRMERIFILENQPRYLSIPEEQRNRLGQESATLGEDLTLGDEVLDCSSCFRVLIEDVEVTTALDFRPDQPAYLALRELIEFLAPAALDFELVLQVREESIARARLDHQGELGINCLLGDAQLNHLELRY